jgi:4-alpha-glucanotransferase
MRFPRGSGILLHPTSLPGEFGIGDLGPAAFHFIDRLAAAGQRYWQILPLGPTGFGDSPYQSFSAFAGNTLLISPELLVGDGLLAPNDLDQRPQFAPGKTDYGGVYHWKGDIIRRAAAHFVDSIPAGMAAEFAAFCGRNEFWLNDYAMYRAVKASQGMRPWYKWPDELKLREDSALQRAAAELAGEVLAEKAAQFLFVRQWAGVKRYANEHGISVIGDLPIFVALDSADVWCNQHLFELNADGTAKFVAGVPPDYFSETGQLWGNPIYEWQAMQADKFSWWAARFSHEMSRVDIVRLDHFIGFTRHWQVPGDDETAENGEWVSAPGRDLFTTLAANLGDLPVIAEDLGALTDEVDELRDEFGFPGMRILQYAFGGDAANRDLPHNYHQDCVAYTGTHDNDTVVGWYKTAPRNVRAHCRKYLHFRGGQVNWAFISGVLASVADIAMIPMQDLLGLGSESRMNVPATGTGNWQWRMSDGEFTQEIAARLRDLTEMYGRIDPTQDA